MLNPLLAPTLDVQEKAVAKDLVLLHSDVGDILGDGLDPLPEASARGHPG